jgi:HlyD family secretion protein
MKKSRRWIGYLLIALAIAAASVWALRPRPVGVDAQPVVTGRFEQAIDEEGRARVIDRFVVSAPVAGLLERPWLRVGDAVTDGAIVAIIRAAPPAIRDPRTAAELRERIGAAEAGQARARAGVEQAKAALERANADWERTRRLAGQGFVSASVEEQARLDVRQQTEALRAAESQAEAARHELMAARASAQEGPPPGASLAQLPRREIRTGSAGTVLKVLQQSEAVVAQGTPLFELGDVRLLEVAAELLSQQAAQVSPGMPVRMSAGTGTPAFEGKVRLVQPVARTKVSALGVEEQRVTVVIDPVPEAPPGVGDGWRVDVSIVTRVEPQATLAPVGAVFRDGDGWAVYVVDGGVARRRPVELVARNARHAWIGQGLAAGDSVVVYPPDALRDGVRVATRG